MISSSTNNFLSPLTMQAPPSVGALLNRLAVELEDVSERISECGREQRGSGNGPKHGPMKRWKCSHSSAHMDASMVRKRGSDVKE